MPCMKLTSASANVRGGVAVTASRESVLLRFPGAPGCTTGARPPGGLACWANPAALKKARVKKTDRTRGAMRHYTIWRFSGQSENPELRYSQMLALMVYSPAKREANRVPCSFII